MPSMRLDAAEHPPSVWISALGGAGLGLAWGIAARLWMRLIAVKPEFSLSGTAAILLIATLFGAFVGLAFAARRRRWQRWGHYLSRGLVVVSFVPFGTGAGGPLMLTVLLATLAVTQPAVVGVWVLTALATLLQAAGIGSWVIAALAPTAAAALALTVCQWITRRGRGGHRLLLVNTWMERLVRTVLLLLAAGGFGFVSWQVMTDKPGWLSPVYVLLYFILLYPLFLALRVGLEPRAAAGPGEAPR